MFSVKILMNLLLNDAKSMSSGSIFEGDIHISLCKSYNSRVCLAVSLSFGKFFVIHGKLKLFEDSNSFKNIYIP